MPRALLGSLKLLKLQKYGFCLVLSQRGKLVPYKLCLMTCTELAGRSCSHPACHIFASRTDKENRSHTRPGLGQQCSRARPLPSFSEPPEMGAGLRGGGWIRVATGDHGSGPFSHPLVVSLILPSHFAWDSHSVCVLLNCPWFVICAQASQITQFVKNLLAVQETWV